MEATFDRRTFSNTFTYRWTNGIGVVSFNSESSNIITNPDHFRRYAIHFYLQTKCFVIRFPGSIAVERVTHPVHSNWLEQFPTAGSGDADAGDGHAVTDVGDGNVGVNAGGSAEFTTAWSEMSSLLNACPNMPSHGLEFLRPKLLTLIQDTLKKTISLDHSTLWISIKIDVKTELMYDNNGDIEREMQGIRWADEDEEGLDDDDDDENWTTGASKKAIKQHLKVEQLGHGDCQAKEVCAVCLEEIGKVSSASADVSSSSSAAAEAGWLECKHVFHPECIIKWLEVGNRCPLCRFEVPEGEGEDVDEEEEEEGEGEEQEGGEEGEGEGDEDGDGDQLDME